MDRHDIESSSVFGQIIGLEVAITALLASHPDKEALRTAFRAAEDMGFTWTEDTSFDQTGRGEIAQKAYIELMNRLRAAARL
ncbi:hypothetical protein [Cognatiluteimonas telluris]|uniref:hypothetical protein n=1 Tax=Cognatiluteimonas telluris TaxID=1104775 RepID=UPI00140AD9F4|nr:hypothetical protein [Lysobacter telluris]